jgi:hypothetical protein
MTRAMASARSHPWLWFAALYVAGVGTLGIVAYGLRLLLKGLT